MRPWVRFVLRKPQLACRLYFMKTPGTIRVLIVDDLEFMRQVLKEILVSEGFIVCGEAKNGKEAVVLFGRLKPDVVLLDITMPEMDGISALGRIRSHAPDALVIMCSAISEETMNLRAIELGARDYVVKPFRPQRVLKALKRAVGLEQV